MYIYSLSNLTMLQSYSDRLGMVHYSLTEHEKVTVITFPLRDGILWLCATLRTNMNKIRDKEMKVLKSTTKQHSQLDETTRRERIGIGE